MQRWRSQAQWQTRKRATLAACVTHMGHSRQRAAIKAWRENARYRADVLGRCTRCVAKIQNQTLARALGSWREAAGRKRELRFAFFITPLPLQDCSA